MSTSLHAVFNVVSGNIYFVIVILNIYGRKMRFSENSESVNMLIRGVVAAARVAKIHSKITPIVFITICVHSAFTFIRF